MSDESHDLEKLGAAWATATAADLTGLFGIQVSISDPKLLHAPRGNLLPKGDSICTRCEIAEEDGQTLGFVLPLRGAMLLAAAQDGKKPEDFASFESREFGEDVAEAYTGAMDLCAGILGRVLDEEAGLPAIQLGDTYAIDKSDCDEALADGSYRCARFELEIEGFPKSRIDLLFGADLAKRWFGAMEPTGAGADDDSTLRVAIVDPSPESRDAFEGIAQTLGAEVLSLDPIELGPDAYEELAEVRWVVLTWDLGGRSGLETLERLRTLEETSHLQFAIASSAPTRAMVDAALRWGARTILYQPWDAGEIRERLAQ